MMMKISEKKSKKMSIDLREASDKWLGDIKENYGTAYGASINDLIFAFASLSDDVKKDFSDFCLTRLHSLSRQMRTAGKLDYPELEDKAVQYLRLMKYLNNGKPINMDDIENMKVLTSINIKNGAVICPDDWVVIDPGSAKEKEYAGVVSCRNAYLYQIPTFIFFSDHKYARDYTPGEKVNINRLCSEISPEFAEAARNQISLVRDPQDPYKYINEREYLASPVIGYFELHEKGDPLFQSEEDFPYGAMIVRT